MISQFLITISFVEIIYACSPNIVMIVTDDMGYNDVSYHGSNQINTPNIDALGYNGHIMEEYYTGPTCTPSRAALTTGQYAIRTGFQGEPLSAGEPRAMPLNVPMLQEVLKGLNYKTHLIGKWHLGYKYKNRTPIERGFDDHYGYWNGFISYKTHMYKEFNGFVGLDIRDNFNVDFESTGEYMTDLLTNRALQVIRNHNTSQPMFLMYTHLAPHSGAPEVGVEVADEQETNKKFGYITDVLRRNYAGAVDKVDESLGQIMDMLAEKEMLKNSIIILFSDNGAQTFGHLHNSGSNWPFRGLKFTLFQGGVKTPSVMWSSLFKEKGVINRNLFHVTDWMPTLIEAAGGDVSNMNLDGKSHWKYLTQTNVNSTRNNGAVLLNIDEKKNAAALISSDAHFKYIEGSYQNGIYDGFYGDDGRSPTTPPYNVEYILNSSTNIAIRKTNTQSPLSVVTVYKLRHELKINESNHPRKVLSCIPHCLFDLYADPTETKNVSSEYPKVTARLQNSLNKYKSELVPQKNQPIDERSNPKYFGGVWTTWLEYVNQ